MLISVWGSQNAGKSLFSTIMGRILAEAGKRTLIVYAGLQSNDTPCFYPDEKEMTILRTCHIHREKIYIHILYLLNIT